MLLEKGMEYILTVDFQSDGIEGTFGKWRQMTGGNYYISADNILACLKAQRLDLLSSLEKVAENYDTCTADCCSTELINTELECIDDCFDSINEISEIKKSALYNVCGYVCKKEEIDQASDMVLAPNDSAAEFVSELSRGGLTHPPAELYNLSLCLFKYFSDTPNKKCRNRLIKAFLLIQECCGYEYSNSVLKRFANTFCAGHVRKTCDAIKIEKQEKNKVKRRRLNC